MGSSFVPFTMCPPPATPAAHAMLRGLRSESPHQQPGSFARCPGPAGTHLLLNPRKGQEHAGPSQTPRVGLLREQSLECLECSHLETRSHALSPLASVRTGPSAYQHTEGWACRGMVVKTCPKGWSAGWGCSSHGSTSRQDAASWGPAQSHAMPAAAFKFLHLPKQSRAEVRKRTSATGSPHGWHIPGSHQCAVSSTPQAWLPLSQRHTVIKCNRTSTC